MVVSGEFGFLKLLRLTSMSIYDTKFTLYNSAIMVVFSEFGFQKLLWIDMNEYLKFMIHNSVIILVFSKFGYQKLLRIDSISLCTVIKVTWAYQASTKQEKLQRYHACSCPRDRRFSTSGSPWKPLRLSQRTIVLRGLRGCVPIIPTDLPLWRELFPDLDISEYAQ